MAEDFLEITRTVCDVVIKNVTELGSMIKSTAKMSIDWDTIANHDTARVRCYRALNHGQFAQDMYTQILGVC